ncbi:MAG: hypothetical protein FWD67_06805 [Betaproteobacteria bacterium]|nr:hypothetical protein [Betaproteobacteria bacterium]
MTSQWMDISPAPVEEDCAQVGRLDYEERSSRECRVFKRMLSRLFPLPENGKASIVIKRFTHDFGSYRQVCVLYDDTDQQAVDYAYLLEGNTPAKWDAIAHYELLWLERCEQLQRAHRQGVLAQSLPDAVLTGSLPDMPADQRLTELLKLYPLPDVPRAANRGQPVELNERGLS